MLNELERLFSVYYDDVGKPSSFYLPQRSNLWRHRWRKDAGGSGESCRMSFCSMVHLFRLQTRRERIH